MVVAQKPAQLKEETRVMDGRVRRHFSVTGPQPQVVAFVAHEYEAVEEGPL